MAGSGQMAGGGPLRGAYSPRQEGLRTGRRPRELAERKDSRCDRLARVETVGGQGAELGNTALSDDSETVRIM
jgi:hypothetical protein